MKIFKKKLLFLFYSLAFLIFLAILPIFFKPAQKTFVVGAKNCTEQNILGEILAQLIEKHTTLKVERKFNLEGTMIAFQALKSKTIDTYIEYTGTALLDILKEPIPNGQLFPYVKNQFAKRFDLVWLDPLGFSNKYVLITRKSNSIRSLSEIQDHLKIAFDPEFSCRLETKLLRENYPGRWKPRLMDNVLLYFSLKNGSVDVISGFATDGQLQSEEFCILEDEKNCFPVYEAAPIMSSETLKKFPEVIPVLALLKNRITLEEMRVLNAQAEKEGKNIPDIARTSLATLL